MALEYWKFPAYTQEGIQFMETTVVWDTKLKKVVGQSSELSLPQAELDRRIAALSPVVLERAPGQEEAGPHNPEK